MTEREAELLEGLEARIDHAFGAHPGDLGASTDTHHSKTLRRMAAKGWVVIDRIGDRHNLYRISSAGVAAHLNHQETQRIAKGLRELEAARVARLRAKMGLSNA